jgi:hypothetical protein
MVSMALERKWSCFTTRIVVYYVHILRDPILITPFDEAEESAISSWHLARSLDGTDIRSNRSKSPPITAARGVLFSNRRVLGS